MLLLGLAALALAAGCLPNFRWAADQEEAGENQPQEPPPPPAAPPPPANPAARVTAPSDIQPGSSEAVELYGDYTIEPPRAFNVFELSEGDDFRTRWVHYRWERLTGGAWFTISFFSGIDYEGKRRPDIHQQSTVDGRLRSVFARIDGKHQLYSRGIVTQKIGGQQAVRTNVAGQLAGGEAIGHLYLIDDGSYLIEIAAVATEENRGVLKDCRQAAGTFAKAITGAEESAPDTP